MTVYSNPSPSAPPRSSRRGHPPRPRQTPSSSSSEISNFKTLASLHSPAVHRSFKTPHSPLVSPRFRQAKPPEISNFKSPISPLRSSSTPSEISNFKSPISLSPRTAPRSLLLPLLTFILLSPALALTGPQPTLPTTTLRLGTATLQAEVADTPETRAIGLMGRTELADGQAMLFVFTQPQPMSFWMHNTLIPLSIAYINAAGVIREIHDMQPLDKTMIRSAFRDHVYALEVPQGWFQKNKILPGDKIHGLPAPSTAQPN